MTPVSTMIMPNDQVSCAAAGLLTGQLVVGDRKCLSASRWLMTGCIQRSIMKKVSNSDVAMPSDVPMQNLQTTRRPAPVRTGPSPGRRARLVTNWHQHRGPQRVGGGRIEWPRGPAASASASLDRRARRGPGGAARGAARRVSHRPRANVVATAKKHRGDGQPDEGARGGAGPAASD